MKRLQRPSTLIISSLWCAATLKTTAAPASSRTPTERSSGAGKAGRVEKVREMSAKFIEKTVNKEKKKIVKTKKSIMKGGNKGAATTALSARDAGAQSTLTHIAAKQQQQQEEYREHLLPLGPSPFTSFSSLVTARGDASASPCLEVSQWIHPTRVHLRVRSLLLQLVLLAEGPYSPAALIAALRAQADPTTLYMCSWAGYALCIFASEHKVKRSDGDGVCAHTDGGDKVQVPRDVAATEEELQALLRVGRAFYTLYNKSILHVYQGLEGHKASAGGNKVECAVFASCSAVPAPSKVLEWMALGTLLSDPYFRISSLGGMVCYPSQPSVLLATWGDVAASPPKAQAIRRATRELEQLVHTATTSTTTTATRSKAVDGRGMYASETSSSIRQQMKSTSTAQPADAAAVAAPCLGDPQTFVWLSPQEEVERKDEEATVSRQQHSGGDRNVAAVPMWASVQSVMYTLGVVNERPDSNLDADEESCCASALITGTCGGGSTGHPLVDQWIQCFEQPTVTAVGATSTDIFGCSAQHVVDGAGGSLSPFASALPRTTLSGVKRESASHHHRDHHKQQYSNTDPRATGDGSGSHSRSSTGRGLIGVGWNECQLTGHSQLRTWITEATEGTLARLTMESLPQQLQSASGGLSIHHVNLRFGAAFLFLISVPISVARLSMLLRWNVSIPFAGTTSHHSLLYFLLVFCGNISVARMQDREETRRQVSRFITHQEKRLRFSAAARAAVAASPVYASQQQQQQQMNSADSDWTLTLREEAAVADYSSPDRVHRLVFFRVLPWRRMSMSTQQWDSDEKVGAQRGGEDERSEGDGEGITCRSGSSSTFAGQRLKHIEVLDTDHQTPRETLQFLAQRRLCEVEKGRGVGTSGSSVSSDAAHAASLNSGSSDVSSFLQWLVNEEEYILCYPVAKLFFEKRIASLGYAWLARARQQQQQQQQGMENERASVLTVGKLARLCLWEHEYGSEMASEMMFAYLSLLPDEVCLSPPLSRQQRQQQEKQMAKAVATARHVDTLAEWVVTLSRCRAYSN